MNLRSSSKATLARQRPLNSGMGSSDRVLRSHANNPQPQSYNPPSYAASTASSSSISSSTPPSSSAMCSSSESDEEERQRLVESRKRLRLGQRRLRNYIDSVESDEGDEDVDFPVSGGNAAGGNYLGNAFSQSRHTPTRFSQMGIRSNPGVCSVYDGLLRKDYGWDSEPRFFFSTSQSNSQAKLIETTPSLPASSSQQRSPKRRLSFEMGGAGNNMLNQ